MKVNGKLCYLWRAVDHEGEVLEVVTAKRDKAAAVKFLKRIMKKYGRPRKIVTDALDGPLAVRRAQREAASSARLASIAREPTPRNDPGGQGWPLKSENWHASTGRPRSCLLSDLPTARDCAKGGGLNSCRNEA